MFLLKFSFCQLISIQIENLLIAVDIRKFLIAILLFWGTPGLQISWKIMVSLGNKKIGFRPGNTEIQVTWWALSSHVIILKRYQPFFETRKEKDYSQTLWVDGKIKFVIQFAVMRKVWQRAVNNVRVNLRNIKQLNNFSFSLVLGHSWPTKIARMHSYFHINKISGWMWTTLSHKVVYYNKYRKC